MLEALACSDGRTTPQPTPNPSRYNHPFLQRLERFRPEWQRLSVRDGRRQVDEGPFEGLPAHLRPALAEWFRTEFAPTRMDPQAEMTLRMMALRLHVVAARLDYFDALMNLLHAAGDDFLDVIDIGLRLKPSITTSHVLDADLLVGGSVWRVNKDHTGLIRRVPSDQQAAYTDAVNPADEAAEHLNTAWSKVYGRSPDPSDAWDHSIKAVEALLWGLVIPKNNGATLGTILTTLADKPSNWTFRLTSSSKTIGNVETLEAVLRLIWPNPDRHASGTARSPTYDEAKTVVQIAVMVVGCLRTGALVKV